MAEACSSRSLSWLSRSCRSDTNPISPEPRRICADLPNLFQHTTPRRPPPNPGTVSDPSPLLSLPDDILVECLSRVPSAALPALSLVCRRFSLLLDSPAFLSRRRSLGILRRSLVALSLSDIGLLSSASHHAAAAPYAAWSVLPCPLPIPSEILEGSASASLSHARLVSLGRSVYALGRAAAARYDTWTNTVSHCPATLFPRKKFAAATVAGKIYIAGGSTRTAAVEEYDPVTETWAVVEEAPRKRYGCVGAAADGIFYVIGGLRVGGRGDEPTSPAAVPSHVYASSMDAYDVRTGLWLRTRPLPGGGCVVGACAAGERVYVLASHAVDVSFWRWEATGKAGRRSGGGEWTKLTPPPVPGQVRVGGALRFACVGAGDSKVVVLMHLSTGDGSRRGLRNYTEDNTAEGRDGWAKEGMVLLYDICTDEWSRGADLPPAFRRATCVCVER